MDALDIINNCFSGMTTRLFGAVEGTVDDQKVIRLICLQWAKQTTYPRRTASTLRSIFTQAGFAEDAGADEPGLVLVKGKGNENSIYLTNAANWSGEESLRQALREFFVVPPHGNKAQALKAGKTASPKP